jgi:ABC-type amino acid transport substrate-binding protein
MIRIRLAVPCLLGLLCLGDAAASAELPAAVRQAGALHASVNAIYPPMEYKDPATGQLTGLDVDLGEALAKRLGVRIVWIESAFEAQGPRSCAKWPCRTIWKGLAPAAASRRPLSHLRPKAGLAAVPGA